MNNGIAGCGGAIRGDSGEWLRGFSIKIGVRDSNQAEAWGILEGLQLCLGDGTKEN